MINGISTGEENNIIDFEGHLRSEKKIQLNPIIEYYFIQ